jgi:hypothetical protein
MGDDWRIVEVGEELGAEILVTKAGKYVESMIDVSDT